MLTYEGDREASTVRIPVAKGQSTIEFCAERDGEHVHFHLDSFSGKMWPLNDGTFRKGSGSVSREDARKLRTLLDEFLA